MHAEAIQVNQIFGIEAGGELTWSSNFDKYITRSTSASHNGAVIMNGKELYQKGEKVVKFNYNITSGNCFGNNTFSFVIKLVDN
jgi:hypothetical protein